VVLLANPGRIPKRSGPLSAVDGDPEGDCDRGLAVRGEFFACWWQRSEEKNVRFPQKGVGNILTLGPHPATRQRHGEIAA